jgi:hypothetical protein
MKQLILIISCILIIPNAFSQTINSNIITSDITNFWAAYDKITATKDSVEQYAALNTLYLDKGTVGLKAFIKLKNVSAKSYINAINRYPLFWQSVRANTLKTKESAEAIGLNINKLKLLYPELKPAKLYFTIGALKSNGTTMDSMVLIGSELAFASPQVETKELPKQFSHLKPYFDSNPIKEIVFLNVHEYVHTQQKSNIGHDVLSYCLLEGVAEFMAVKAMEKASPNSAIAFGKQNNEVIKQSFIKDMFTENYDNWLWNSFDNAFKMRDLGYYVGYAICEEYYDKAKDKKQAIKDMIQLDYNDELAVGKFVDKSGYLPKSIKKYRKAFDKTRPIVLNIKEFKKDDKNVNPNIKQITIEFSAKMNKETRGLSFGPLGEKFFLPIKDFIGFSEDGKSATFTIELKPNQQYQFIVNQQFTTENGVPMHPFLIDIKTAGN